MKPKVIVIVGPTATGKSDLAVALALKLGGEIISADSRQVYKGLNLGTGKITKKEMLGVPHHLLDAASPKKQFNADQYRKLADKAIASILKKGCLPVIVGGTGFYIETLLSQNPLPNVPPNNMLRKKLEKKNTDDLFKELQALDADRAETIDRYNRVRLIRAIEIATALGKVPNLDTTQKYETLFIGLTLPDANLQNRIKNRLSQRTKKGMIREVSKLHKEGLSWKRMEELGLEYRYIAQFLQKKISKKEMLETLEKEIWQYAKRQTTWFKRNKEINWMDPTKKDTLKKAERLTKAFIGKSQ